MSTEFSFWGVEMFWNEAVVMVTQLANIIKPKSLNFKMVNFTFQYM